MKEKGCLHWISFFQYLIRNLQCNLNWIWLIKNWKSNAMKKPFCFDYTFLKQKSIAMWTHEAFCVKTEFNTSKKFLMNKKASIFSFFLLVDIIISEVLLPVERISVQSFLVQPLCGNMKDVFGRALLCTSCWYGKFSTANVTPGRFRLITNLWKMTSLQEKIPCWFNIF